MPEITSVENIRTKLLEFQKHLDSVKRMTENFENYKTKIEGMLKQAGDASNIINEHLKETGNIKSQFLTLQKEIESLNNDSKGLNEKLNLELKRLDKICLETKEDIISSSNEYYSKHEVFINDFDLKLNQEAAIIKEAKETVTNTSIKVEELLRQTRNELQTENEKLLMNEIQRLNTLFEEFCGIIEKKAEEHRNNVISQNNVQREEIKKWLQGYQQSTSSKMTDFLNKQNAMVQNMLQQIEVYRLASQTYSEQLNMMNENMKKVSADFGKRINSQGRFIKAVQGQIDEKIDKMGKNLSENLEFMREEITQLKNRGFINKMFGKK